MWLICHWDFCRWNIRGFINNWGNVTFWEWWTCHDKERLYKQFGIWICFWFLIVKLNQNINKFGDSIKCKSVTLGEQLGCFPPKIVSSEKANTVEPTDRQTDISYKLCGHIYEAWCSVERRAEGSEGRWCYAISTPPPSRALLPPRHHFHHLLSIWKLLVKFGILLRIYCV